MPPAALLLVQPQERLAPQGPAFSMVQHSGRRAPQGGFSCRFAAIHLLAGPYKDFFFRLLEEYGLHTLQALQATHTGIPAQRKCAPGGVWGGGLNCGSNSLNASPGGFFASFLAETRKEGPAGTGTIIDGDCHSLQEILAMTV